MNTNDIFNFKQDTAAITNVGLVRKENEDNFGYAYTNNGHVFVVCDGMGGHVGGKEASSTAVNAIMNFFSSKIFLNIPKGMEEAMKYANKAVFDKALNNTNLKGMGTTIVMVVIKEDKVYVGHVGDSRIYLLTDNNLIRLTKDHSYVQELFDRGIISNEEMRTHSRKNEITKALGLTQEVEPEVTKEPLLLKNGDTLLLCSDGLTDMVDDANIREVLITNNNVGDAAQQLLHMALTAGGKDNITMQLIKITNSNYKDSIYENKNNINQRELDQDTLVDEHVISNSFNDVEKTGINIKSFYKNPLLLAGVIGVAFMMFMLLGKGGEESKNEDSLIEKSKIEKPKVDKTAKANQNEFVIVKKGMTLDSIAHKYAIPVDKLIKWNKKNISNPNNLKQGEKVFLISPDKRKMEIKESVLSPKDKVNNIRLDLNDLMSKVKEFKEKEKIDNYEAGEKERIEKLLNKIDERVNNIDEKLKKKEFDKAREILDKTKNLWEELNQ